MNNLDVTRIGLPQASGGGPRRGRVIGLLRRLAASDRLWIAGSSVFSRCSNFCTNVILARYGGEAVLGAYAAILNTATTAVSPVLWSVSTSATLETRAAVDERARQAAAAAHVYWSLLIAIGCGLAFLGLLQIADDVAPHDTLPRVVGLVVVAGMLIGYAMQGALHGAGAYKPSSTRMVTSSILCMIVAVPAVLAFGIVGALVALAFQYVLVAAALTHLARPRFGDRRLIRHALRAARQQLVHSVPNVLATLVTAFASWLTTLYLVQQTHGIAGVGTFAVAASWLTIVMMPVCAWGGLSMRCLSAAHARSAQDFRGAIRHVLAKDASITLAFAAAAAIFAEPIARLYGLADTPLPTILRVNLLTALVLTATQTFERAMFCDGRQGAWMRARLGGNTCKVALAIVLIPRGLAYVAVAQLAGYSITAITCVVYLRRGRR